MTFSFLGYSHTSPHNYLTLGSRWIKYIHSNPPTIEKCKQGWSSQRTASLKILREGLSCTLGPNQTGTLLVRDSTSVLWPGIQQHPMPHGRSGLQTPGVLDFSPSSLSLGGEYTLKEAQNLVPHLWAIGCILEERDSSTQLSCFLRSYPCSLVDGPLPTHMVVALSSVMKLK